MAFALTGLKMLGAGGSAGAAPGNVVNVYSYATADNAAAVEAAGYFNGAADYLKHGDVIIASLVVGGVAVQKNYIVQSNDGTTVAVTVGI